MDPETKNRLPAEPDPSLWKRLTRALRVYRPVAWRVFLVASLLLFLAWMPPLMLRLIWSRLAARGLLSGMLLIFGLLAVSLVWSQGQRIDVWAFLIINLWGPRPAWLDWVMLGITQIGNGFTALVMGLILFLAGDRLAAYELILGSITLWIVVELVKAVVRRSRPFTRLAQARIVGYRESGRSFPSGHTSQAFFLATLLAAHFEASVWGVVGLYLLAVLVGITRMYVGAHYPRDVLAGAILGSVWGFLGVIVDGFVMNSLAVTGI